MQSALIIQSRGMLLTRSSSGFTLIELMIVVAIIAILSTIALPNYRQYVKRSERAAVCTTLLQAAHWMEHRFTVNNSYLDPHNGNPSLPEGLSRSPLNSNGDAIKYDISVLAQTAHYKLQAIPRSVDECGTFTLDQSGGRGLIGNTAALDMCWGR